VVVGGSYLALIDLREATHDVDTISRLDAAFRQASELELPPSLVRLVVAGAGALGDGDSVALVSEEAEVSPAEAARLLGVSRQYVDRLVAKGVLPARLLPQSRYRKIPARAVLAYRAAKDAKRRGIASILEAADEAGVPY
jgi:excisionase family DNA binding protein